LVRAFLYHANKKTVSHIIFQTVNLVSLINIVMVELLLVEGTNDTAGADDSISSGVLVYGAIIAVILQQLYQLSF